MSQLIGLPSNWKEVETLESAKQMVDYGVILRWGEVKRLVKVLTKDEQKEFVGHIAARFSEDHESRLPEELMIESLLNWLVHAKDESSLQAFLEALLENPNRSEASLKLVEIALTTEISETEHDDDVFAMAVSLICELGLAIKALGEQYPEHFDNPHAIFGHISTYLLSVSNTNNNCIRLSLLNYFGSTEQGLTNKVGFNKIMGRFGHTVLDQLFFLLFQKKTEAISLQYLLENIPYILEGDMHSQRIVHETFKFYMLKKPERFGLFVQTFTKHIQSLEAVEAKGSKRVFTQHLGALLQVVNEVNHKPLARELICALSEFRLDASCREVVAELSKDQTMRPLYKELLNEIAFGDDMKKVIDSTSRFVSSKRGRKPSFQRAGDILTISQVQFLGNQTAAKAS
ncbi:hypothetical protein N9D31_03250 [Oligoflexaceae bacterium]|nr:hypothetical protein [Oligoflexaceae bacterium]